MKETQSHGHHVHPEKATNASGKIHEISDTAFWVSAYRAKESKRFDALFVDPYAETLAGEKGKRIANRVSDSRYAEWTVVIRTRVIDEIIQSFVENHLGMVVNVGAGLDTRPYRLSLPESLLWVEIDHPHVIQFKEEKLMHEKPLCEVIRIGLDLSHETERKKLFSELNGENGRSLVLTEGVIPYLTEDQVSSLAKDLYEQSNFHHWIVEYHAKEMYRHLRGKRKDEEMGGSPFRFFPQEWIPFFENHGWAKKDLFYLGEEGKNLGRPFPIPTWAKVLQPLIPKRERDKLLKMSGFLLLEKK
ncbi:MAG: SAM-dependent methyltransferase [Bdellovibrionota bacterium]